MFKKLRRRIADFIVGRAAAAGRFIIGSRPYRWIARRRAMRFIVRVLLVLWLFLANRIWWPVKRVVRRARKYLGRREVWFWAVAWIGCVWLALGIIFASPVKVFAAVLAIMLGGIVLRRIELGVIAFMILAASIVYPSAIPQPMTLGGMGPLATEWLLIVMLLYVFVRSCAQKKFEFLKNPLTLPLLLFLASGVISILVSYSLYSADPRGHWPFVQVYNKVRPIFYYTLFFVVAFGLQSVRQLSLVLRTLIWISVVVSVMMTIQGFFGAERISLFIGGTFNPYIARPVAYGEAEIARVQPPGLGPILVLLLVCVTTAAYRGLRAGSIHALAAAMLGIGVLFCFYRNMWVSTLLGMSIVWIFADRNVKKRLPAFFLAAVALTIVGSISIARAVPGTVGERFVNSLKDRSLSIVQRQTYTTDESLLARYREIRESIARIKESPVFGIGADTPRQHQQWTRRGPWTKVIYPVYYIHNSYLEVWMVYGLLGIVSFLWLSIAFLVRSLILFTRLEDNAWKAVAIAFFAGYVGFLWRSWTQMHIIHDGHHIATAALMWGTIEVLWRLHDQGGLSKRNLEPSSVSSAVTSEH